MSIESDKKLVEMVSALGEQLADAADVLGRRVQAALILAAIQDGYGNWEKAAEATRLAVDALEQAGL